jgi:hypothetical protein
MEVLQDSDLLKMNDRRNCRLLQVLDALTKFHHRYRWGMVFEDAGVLTTTTKAALVHCFDNLLNVESLTLNVNFRLPSDEEEDRGALESLTLLLIDGCELLELVLVVTSLIGSNEADNEAECACVAVMRMKTRRTKRNFISLSLCWTGFQRFKFRGC